MQAIKIDNSLQSATYKNMCTGMHNSVNLPYSNFSALIYWGGTLVNNKAKANLSQQVHTAHCQPDATV